MHLYKDLTSPQVIIGNCVSKESLPSELLLHTSMKSLEMIGNVLSGGLAKGHASAARSDLKYALNTGRYIVCQGSQLQESMILHPVQLIYRMFNDQSDFVQYIELL